MLNPSSLLKLQQSQAHTARLKTLLSIYGINFKTADVDCAPQGELFALFGAKLLIF
jgi:hypothetical protein